MMAVGLGFRGLGFDSEIKLKIIFRGREIIMFRSIKKK